MARIRTIKPEFWLNEELASLSDRARLLAIALLNHSDDKGLFLANPALVRAACFPFDEHSQNVLGGLQELSRIGYVEVRECSGKTIGRVVNFLEHQRIDKPQKSKLIALWEQGEPQGNAVNNEDSAQFQDHSKNVPGILPEDSENVPRPERKGKEGKGKDQAVATAPSPPEKVWGTLPTKDGSEWELKDSFWQELVKAYPRHDIYAECKAMKIWLISNPAKQKTPGGMKRFVNGWLSKAEPTKPDPAANKRPRGKMYWEIAAERHAREAAAAAAKESAHATA